MLKNLIKRATQIGDVICEINPKGSWKDHRECKLHFKEELNVLRIFPPTDLHYPDQLVDGEEEFYKRINCPHMYNRPLKPNVRK